MRYRAIPPLREAVRWALEDKTTRRELRTYLERAYAAQAPIEEALRDGIRDARDRVFRSFEAQLETLQRTAAEAGMTLHRAESAEDVQSVLRRVFEQVSARRVVTAWAPLIDEVGVRDVVQAAGASLSFVDVGGYVLQQTQEPPPHPTHLLAHMSMRDLALVLSDVWGQEVRAQGEPIVENIVSRTRRAVASADVGIVSASFVVVESGHPVLLDEEGGRVLAATLPKTVVVLAGMESLVATWQDLSLMVRGYWQGARGRSVPPYVSIVPGREAEREIHLVLVDNGRQKLMNSPYREALYCLHCGACATACPLFREVGGQVYATPYMGPIGSVWASVLWPGEHKGLPEMSVLCGACVSACPVGIDIPALIARLRAEQYREEAEERPRFSPTKFKQLLRRR